MSDTVESMKVAWWTAPVGEFTPEEIRAYVEETAHAHIAMAEQKAPDFVAEKLGYMPEIVRIESEQPKVGGKRLIPTPWAILIEMNVFYKVQP